MANSDFNGSQLVNFRPVEIGPEPGPVYVGLQPNGAGSPVTRVSKNFSTIPEAFDARSELLHMYPGCGVFADPNNPMPA